MTTALIVFATMVAVLVAVVVILKRPKGATGTPKPGDPSTSAPADRYPPVRERLKDPLIRIASTMVALGIVSVVLMMLFPTWWDETVLPFISEKWAIGGWTLVGLSVCYLAIRVIAGTTPLSDKEKKERAERQVKIACCVVVCITIFIVAIFVLAFASDTVKEFKPSGVQTASANTANKPVPPPVPPPIVGIVEPSQWSEVFHIPAHLDATWETTDGTSHMQVSLNGGPPYVYQPDLGREFGDEIKTVSFSPCGGEPVTYKLSFKPKVR